MHLAYQWSFLFVCFVGLYAGHPYIHLISFEIFYWLVVVHACERDDKSTTLTTNGHELFQQRVGDCVFQKRDDSRFSIVKHNSLWACCTSHSPPDYLIVSETAKQMKLASTPLRALL